MSAMVRRTLSMMATLIVDNPVLIKDASLLLRRRLVAAIWLLVGCGLLLLMGGTYLASAPDNLRLWGTLHVPGGEMLTVLTGVLLAAVTFLLPALASTSLTSERESGTLPLLIASGLSPERLVVGKVAGIFTAAAPFFALTLPLFALCSVVLGVDIGDVALAGVGVVVHALTLCCVGVWASAVCDRTRSAALVAVMAALVPSALGAVPVFVSVVSVADDQQRIVVVGVVGLIIELVIGAAAVVGAWSVLAPQRAARAQPGRWLLVATLLGVPVVAAALLLCSGNDNLDVAVGVTLQVSALVVGVVALAPVITGRRLNTPTPARTALLAVIVGAVGLGLSSLGWPERMLESIPVGDVAAFFSVFAAVGGVAAFTGRWLKTPAVAFFLTAGVFIALFAVPAIIDEFVAGDPPLAFLNLAYVVDHANQPPVPTLLFYGALALVTLLCARGARRSA